MKNRITKVDDGTTAQIDPNNVLAARKAKCYNCKHASSAFKIAGKTHHQCNHPKHDKGFENGTLSPWDTLKEFYNSCNTHEFRYAIYEEAKKQLNEKLDADEQAAKEVLEQIQLSKQKINGN